MVERVYVRFFLIVPALVVLYFVFRIFQPFFQPILLAVMLASLCYPVYRKIQRALRGRDNLAAFLTCMLITTVIVVPFVFLVFSLARQVGEVYSMFQTQLANGTFDRLLSLEPDGYLAPLIDWANQYVDFSKIDLIGSIATAFQTMSVFFLRHSTEILGGFAEMISEFFIMIVTMFFLFRDGARLGGEIQSMTPLSERYEKTLVQKFKQITKATVLGSLVTALAQGVAGGLVFWGLGASNLVFWSAMIALFSLVPVVGSSIIWGPWALYFLVTGSVLKAIILVALAVLVIGMIDNILRPLFIEGQIGMHTLIVFFSIMGGIAYFGIIGIIFGPILVSLGLTFLELYRTEFQKELKKLQ